MWGDIFYWLFNMSLIAGLCGLIVLGLRAIPRFPRRFACLLWLIPLVRMWVPFGVGSRWNLMSLLSKFTTRTVVVWEKGDMSIATTNMIMAADRYFPITYRIDPLHAVFHWAAVVWLTVALAILLTLGVLYVTTKRELRDAILWRDNVYLSDKVTSPALYGVLRPRIILPTGWETRDDLAFILAHERAHARRGDNLWRLVGFVTAALHWFNPLSWLFLKTFLSDLELACDERVMRDMDTQACKQYALSLVSGARDGRERTLFASAFGGAGVRVRVERILGYRRLSFFSTVCFMLLSAAIAYVLLAAAK